MKRMGLFGALMLLTASRAVAQEEREACFDRPGLGTPPCTVPPGKLVVELGLGDWTLDRTANTRTDTVVIGDTLVRIGVADHAEVRIGWAAFGHQRERDRSTGAVDKNSGVGDLTLAVNRNLLSPDGSGTSVSVLPYVTIPAGGSTIGAGDWGAGVLIPASFELSRSVSLTLAPEIDAAVDEDHDGRHLAYGSVVGLGFSLSDAVSASTEIQLIRDRDPGGYTTQALAGLSIAWQPGEGTQVDAGTNLGLNHASPDVQVYLGVARRF
jgi:hypothetical protein